MITKKQLCEAVLSDYAIRTLKMDIPVDITKIPESAAITSSKVGIAMEYLGLLNDHSIKNYIANRGGVIITTMGLDDKPMVISFRDILESMKE